MIPTVGAGIGLAGFVGQGCPLAGNRDFVWNGEIFYVKESIFYFHAD
jgi:hypothetical protein